MKRVVMAVLGLWSVPSLHAADVFPSRPIRWIVPSPPGGGTDAVSRIMAPRLVDLWKQQIVIDNRGGVQGSLGTALAAKSAPDGYTIVFAYSGPVAVNPHLYREVGYDALKDLSAITRYTQQPMIMTAHPSLPVTTLKELAAYARQNPGRVTFASSASLQHLGGELFKLAAGVNMTHVPYKGAGPAVQAVVAGESSVTITSPAAVIGFLREGRLRALAIDAKSRAPQLPEVPTLVEAGGEEDTLVATYFAFAAPAKTPGAIVEQIGRAHV